MIDPGKPWQNGATESFNGKFRDECLSLEWFRSRAEAKVVIETWRRHYNEVRPHSSLGYLTPAEFVAKLEEQDAASVPGNGPGRCGMWGLRAPARCTTVPQGANEGRNRGGRLKLTVVRRNRAGQRRALHSWSASASSSEFNVSSTVPRTTRSKCPLIRSSSVRMTLLSGPGIGVSSFVMVASSWFSGCVLQPPRENRFGAASPQSLVRTIRTSSGPLPNRLELQTPASFA